jgi:hypothetical protein
MARRTTPTKVVDNFVQKPHPPCRKAASNASPCQFDDIFSRKKPFEINDLLGGITLRAAPDANGGEARSAVDESHVGFAPARASGDGRPHGSSNCARIWQVGALCRAIADFLDARLNPVAVRGEISGFSRAASGHCYFTLKDPQGQLRCAMFRRAASCWTSFRADGDLVEVQGRVAVYEPRGDLQLVVESLQRRRAGRLVRAVPAAEGQAGSGGPVRPGPQAAVAACRAASAWSPRWAPRRCTTCRPACAGAFRTCRWCWRRRRCRAPGPGPNWSGAGSAVPHGRGRRRSTSSCWCAAAAPSRTSGRSTTKRWRAPSCAARCPW